MVEDFHTIISLTIITTIIVEIVIVIIQIMPGMDTMGKATTGKATTGQIIGTTDPGTAIRQFIIKGRVPLTSAIAILLFHPHHLHLHPRSDVTPQTDADVVIEDDLY